MTCIDSSFSLDCDVIDHAAPVKTRPSVRTISSVVVNVELITCRTMLFGDVKINRLKRNCKKIENTTNFGGEPYFKGRAVRPHKATGSWRNRDIDFCVNLRITQSVSGNRCAVPPPPPPRTSSTSSITHPATFFVCVCNTFDTSLRSGKISALVGDVPGASKKRHLDGVANEAH